MIQLTDIYKNYRTGKSHSSVLQGVNFSVENGEFIAVLGPSGSGKSTLLNILGLIDKPSNGKYLFKGDNIHTWSDRQKSRLRQTAFGFVFQSFNLIDSLTVFDNIALPLVYLKVPEEERIQRVIKALDQFEIKKHLNHFPSQLSGGLQQRVAIARALIHEPDLILADEPTGNLDSTNSQLVMQVLKELHEQGKTIVMVTHSYEEAQYSSRLVRMLDGQIIMEGKQQFDAMNV